MGNQGSKQATFDGNQQGNVSATAMFNLGAFYEFGIGINKDLEKAVEWYQRRADKGDAAAMIQLGLCYFNGNGVEKDSKKAVEWYQRGADNGNTNGVEMDSPKETNSYSEERFRQIGYRVGMAILDKLVHKFDCRNRNTFLHNNDEGSGNQ